MERGWRKHIYTGTVTGRQDDCMREGGRKRSAVEHTWRNDRRSVDGSQKIGAVAVVVSVTSVVWSSDGSKLYSASDEFARVFDSVSGTLLHQFENDHVLHFIALSPKHNILACVGFDTAQLWDTESHQPIGQSFGQEDLFLYWVSFSRDGRYLAYGGDDNKFTLWMVTDIASDLAVRDFMSILHGDNLHSTPVSILP